MPLVDFNDLIGRTFLLPPQEDGQQFRERIIEAIDTHEIELTLMREKLQKTHPLVSSFALSMMIRKKKLSLIMT
jgi:hypothetical protein